MGFRSGNKAFLSKEMTLEGLFRTGGRRSNARASTHYNNVNGGRQPGLIAAWINL